MQPAGLTSRTAVRPESQIRGLISPVEWERGRAGPGPPEQGLEAWQ